MRYGRILAAVSLLLATSRLATAGGQLDLSYGTNGFVTIESGPWGERFQAHGAARSLDPASPDAVVLVGVAAVSGGLGTYSAAVTPAGGLVGPNALGLGTATNYGAFNRIVSDPTGLYVAGTRYVEGATPPSAFLVGRLTPGGGGFDPAWGGGAPVVTAIPGTTQSAPTALAVQPDGKVLTAGSANDGSDSAVVRYDATGALDPDFGAGGSSVITGAYVQALALQSDGRILLAGFFVDGPFAGFGVMRLLADGSLDAGFGTAFGAAGVATTSFAARYTQGVAVGVQVLPDGRIAAAGSDWDPYGRKGSFVAARYLGDGSPDPTFGKGKGRFRKRVGKSNVAGAIAFLSDGKILIAGTARRKHPEYHSDIALLRLDASGKPDRTYGRGGKVQIAAVPDTQGFRVRDVVIDSLGRATVVGVSAEGAGKATILTRYLP
jgi:uncharacterized delta-60 repeat protein